VDDLPGSTGRSWPAGGFASASWVVDAGVADAVRGRPCRGPPHRV